MKHLIVKILKDFLIEGKVKPNERDKIYENDEWVVVKPLTHNASCKYGAFTSWCVSVKSNESHFSRYSKNGILIYFINKKEQDKKYSYFFSLSDNHYKKLNGWYDKTDNNNTGIPIKEKNPFNIPSNIMNLVDTYIKDYIKKHNTNQLNSGDKSINQYNDNLEKNGYWEEYWDNGRIEKSGEYVDGKKEGEWLLYTKQGYLLASGHYKGSKKVGVWNIYDKNKNIIKQITYDSIKESFDKKQTLEILDIKEKYRSITAIVGNGLDIEGEIVANEGRGGVVNIGFNFTDNNVNSSVSAWLKLVSMCPIILEMYIDKYHPDVISIATVKSQMARIYKSNNFIDLFKHYVGDNYEVIPDRHPNIVFFVKKNVDEETIENMIKENIVMVNRAIKFSK
jgi:antitoxin component YwqK of YwqJK toxin-antitoxin module